MLPQELNFHYCFHAHLCNLIFVRKSYFSLRKWSPKIYVKPQPIGRTHMLYQNINSESQLFQLERNFRNCTGRLCLITNSFVPILSQLWKSFFSFRTSLSSLNKIDTKKRFFKSLPSNYLPMLILSIFSKWKSHPPLPTRRSTEYRRNLIWTNLCVMVVYLNYAFGITALYLQNLKLTLWMAIIPLCFCDSRSSSSEKNSPR